MNKRIPVYNADRTKVICDAHLSSSVNAANRAAAKLGLPKPRPMDDHSHAYFALVNNQPAWILPWAE